MKVAIKIALLLLVVGYLIFAIVEFSQRTEERVCEAIDIEITDRVDLNFYCNCDKDRVERALMLIGEKEIQEMIDEGKEVELKCHFCNKAYNFSIDEVKDIRKRV